MITDTILMITIIIMIDDDVFTFCSKFQFFWNSSISSSLLVFSLAIIFLVIYVWSGFCWLFHKIFMCILQLWLVFLFFHSHEADKLAYPIQHISMRRNMVIIISHLSCTMSGHFAPNPSIVYRPPHTVWCLCQHRPDTSDTIYSIIHET